MYGDQCREFVRGYWGKTNLACNLQIVEIICLVKDRQPYVSILCTFESFAYLSFVMILSVGPGV